MNEALFKAHELGIVGERIVENDVYLTINRDRARYFGRPMSDAARGSTADRKFENIVKFQYAPRKAHIFYTNSH